MLYSSNIRAALGTGYRCEMPSRSGGRPCPPGAGRDADFAPDTRIENFRTKWRAHLTVGPRARVIVQLVMSSRLGRAILSPVNDVIYRVRSHPG